MSFGDAPLSPRPNDATVEGRIEEVLQLRLEGKPFHKILQHSAKSGWGIKERQLREYVKRADDLLVERQENKRRRIIALHLTRREDLYDRALMAEDHRTALAVLSDLADIQSLYARERDLREIAKLAADQEERIRVLENQLREASKRNTGEVASEQETSERTGDDGGRPIEPAIVAT